MEPALLETSSCCMYCHIGRRYEWVHDLPSLGRRICCEQGRAKVFCVLCSKILRWSDSTLASRSKTKKQLSNHKQRSCAQSQDSNQHNHHPNSNANAKRRKLSNDGNNDLDVGDNIDRDNFDMGVGDNFGMGDNFDTALGLVVRDGGVK